MSNDTFILNLFMGKFSLDEKEDTLTEIFLNISYLQHIFYNNQHV